MVKNNYESLKIIFKQNYVFWNTIIILALEVKDFNFFHMLRFKFEGFAQVNWLAIKV